MNGEWFVRRQPALEPFGTATSGIVRQGVISGGGANLCEVPFNFFGKYQPFSVDWFSCYLTYSRWICFNILVLAFKPTKKDRKVGHRCAESSR